MKRNYVRNAIHDSIDQKPDQRRAQETQIQGAAQDATRCQPHGQFGERGRIL